MDSTPWEIAAQQAAVGQEQGGETLQSRAAGMKNTMEIPAGWG